jgi:hypothetical protein
MRDCTVRSISMPEELWDALQEYIRVQDHRLTRSSAMQRIVTTALKAEGIIIVSNKPPPKRGIELNRLAKEALVDFTDSDEVVEEETDVDDLLNDLADLA